MTLGEQCFFAQLRWVPPAFERLGLVVLLVVAGCGEKTGSAVSDHASKENKISAVDTPKEAVPPPSTAPAPPFAELLRAKNDGDERQIEVLSNGEVTFLKPLSARSFSLKLTLGHGAKAVFKPMLRDDFRARYEVAAYRMARHLGVDGLPVAVMRSLGLEFIALRLEKQNPAAAAELRKRANPDGRGRIAGAMIDWIDDIDPNGLSKVGGVKSVMRWISSKGPSLEQEPLAAQAATMVAFDYVIGNWDRFSGGNLFVAGERRRLVLLDHNGAFFRWADVRRQKMTALLGRLERLSRSFVNKIKLLDEKKIELALSGDPWHRSRGLLGEGEVSLVLQRRDELMRHVESLVRQRGEAAVLVFP
jgi:hypothetical protein